MLFRATAILSIVCLIQGAIAALTPSQVVTNIQTLTSVSRNINVSLKTLSTTSSIATVKAVNQNVFGNFTIIVNYIKGDITAMSQTPPFNEVDAGPIVAALKEFVAVHQALLATVIGKHAIFAQFGVTAPIAAVLRLLEAAIDNLAYSLINLIPTGRTSVTSDKDTLDASVGNTIKTYDQVCIPNPLYPRVLPVCTSL